jgi:hypothetical protein
MARIPAIPQLLRDEILGMSLIPVFFVWMSHELSRADLPLLWHIPIQKDTCMEVRHFDSSGTIFS